MRVLINDEPRALEPGTTVAELLALVRAVPPFAVAVNRHFVPRSSYAAHPLNDDDHIEVIRPVTGG